MAKINGLEARLAALGEEGVARRGGGVFRRIREAKGKADCRPEVR